MERVLDWANEGKPMVRPNLIPLVGAAFGFLVGVLCLIGGVPVVWLPLVCALTMAASLLIVRLWPRRRG